MKRVPQLTPSAPKAKAAASCLPSPTPPLAMKGMLSLRAAFGSNTQFPATNGPTRAKGWLRTFPPQALHALQPRWTKSKERNPDRYTASLSTQTCGLNN